MRLKAALPVVVLAGALAIGASACGSSKNDSSSTSPSASSTAPIAALPDLSKGVSTSVALDAGFVQALTALKLTPSTFGTATLANGAISFPITGGNVSYYSPTGPVQPYVTGIIHHVGSGLNLAAGGTTVSLRNFDVDPGASKLYGDVYANDKLVVSHAYLFFLNGSTLQPLDTTTKAGDAILTGTKVEVSPDAAALLDKTFNTTAVTPNFLVGVATITVATS